jgi:hypothetical protein
MKALKPSLGAFLVAFLVDKIKKFDNKYMSDGGKIVSEYSSQYYWEQSYREMVSLWLFDGKIELQDITPELRIEGGLYTMALRRIRELRLIEKYVAILRVLLSDVAFARDHHLYQYQHVVKELWDAMYWGESEFKGEEHFDEFVYEQKNNQNTGFAEFELSYPNRYAITAN